MLRPTARGWGSMGIDGRITGGIVAVAAGSRPSPARRIHAHPFNLAKRATVSVSRHECMTDRVSERISMQCRQEFWWVWGEWSDCARPPHQPFTHPLVSLKLRLLPGTNEPIQSWGACRLSLNAVYQVALACSSTSQYFRVVAVFKPNSGVTLSRTIS